MSELFSTEEQLIDMLQRRFRTLRHASPFESNGQEMTLFAEVVVRKEINSWLELSASQCLRKRVPHA